MDVPISLGVMLALGMSVLQTLAHERVAYFDSAVMLLMFLLAGRYLDQRMRRRTRDFAINLSAIRADRAVKLFDGGEARETPIAAIHPGDIVLVRAGERVAVDGTVEDGRSEIDQSLVTGETAPVEVAPGRDGLCRRRQSDRRAARPGDGARRAERLLDEVNGLLAKAVEQRSSYVALADRAARLYVPVVHVTALATFLGWLRVGAGWQQALLVAITVLIITCPCALGLAVPAVQVVAAGALFRRGLILNSGEALERLAEADTVVFDKTGTLTQPRPTLANAADIAAGRPRACGRRSRSRAAIRSPRRSPRRRARRSRWPPRNIPGEGVSAHAATARRVRLGSVAWCDAGGGGGAGRRSMAGRFADRAEDAEARRRLRRAPGPAPGRARGGRRDRGAAMRSRSCPATASRRSRWSRASLASARFEAGLKPADKIARLEGAR